MKEHAPNFAIHAGPRPHAPVSRRPRARSLVPLVLLGGVVAGCSNGSASVNPPVVLGLTSTAAPYYSDDEITLYEAQTQVPLPIIKPTSAQEQALGKGVAPFPHAPYLLSTDVSVEIHYTITNVDKTPNTIELLIDPWNEFGRWSPGVTVVDDDDTEPNFSGIDEYFLVQGQSRIEGTITSDDMVNLAANLATVENVLLAPPANLSVDLGTFCNHVFNIQHRSNDGDPLVTPYIPKVIPGVTGFDLGIRTEAQANVAIEIVLDITDNNGNRVIPQGTSGTPIGRPERVFSPPGALQGN